jgi:predicted metal-dependent hydrolase
MFMRKSKVSRLTTLPKRETERIGAPVEVRHHPAARRLTLRVSRTRRAVIVTLPVQCGIEEAGSFLHRNLEWVRERLDSLPAPIPFRNAMLVPVRGIAHRVVMPGEVPRRRVVRRIEAHPLPELHAPGELAAAVKRLELWFAKEARADLQERVAFHAVRLGVSPGRLTIRDQTSRWGSCSTTGGLSFSWRLVLAPPPILDYVAAHEVAHLREMNHGPRFWALVRETCPAMDEAKRWLRIYGMDLHRYGVESGS